MKVKPILTLLVFSLIGYSCKKEKSDSLSLLTSKKWRTTRSVYEGPSKLSMFSECEIGDIYTFSANSLTVKQSQPNCSTRQFTTTSGFNYTLDFTSNTIISEDGIYYYISSLTTDTLKMHQKISYGTSTVKIQYIFIH
ncbi:hypothetical protein GM921_05555 [Pedobacter sp. LMG 31464]|uniref:Lipocalin-like domain-containing protein n=1 Tax=Pedobacter planticolens TaxID=2679964 RepID=A0A923DZW1_9SPHI|nr:lipocalin family protein [Pedobacter planticolens]MBB2144937.1 hypothetical protein [Pedobacter planticolens]